MAAETVDEDLIVTSDAEHLARWHMGEFTLAHAIRTGVITVDGAPRLVRALKSWGGQTPFADEAREVETV